MNRTYIYGLADPSGVQPHPRRAALAQSRAFGDARVEAHEAEAAADAAARPTRHRVVAAGTDDQTASTALHGAAAHLPEWRSPRDSQPT
jgi:hypothetical protein